MGQHAEDFINLCIGTEDLRDSYLDGYMSDQEAFDNGFLDSTGYMVGMDEALSKREVWTYESSHDALKLAESQLSGYEIGMDNLRYENMTRSKHGTPQEEYEEYIYQKNNSGVVAGSTNKFLTEKAVENLYNEVPTCNICETLMKPRQGKFGLFYYCTCEDQPTVSDNYWQMVRRIRE